MAECLDDGELWLPLSDDQLLLSRSLHSRDGLADSAAHNRGFFSSSFDLTETDSDFMAGLTGKLARSTLGGHSFAPNNAKGRSHNGSPQSTLSWDGSKGGSPMSRKESSPAATWDILYKAAGEVARMRSPTPTVKTHHPHPGFYQRRLQAAKLELLRQQRSGHVRGTGGGGHFLVQNRATPIAIGGVKTARPSPPQHIQANGYSVYVGAKRECAGTGVFLPRRNVAAPKKPGCSVIVPARVARALNLNLEEMGGQPQLVNGRIGRGRFEHPPQPGRKHEIRLPQEWTY